MRKNKKITKFDKIMLVIFFIIPFSCAFLGITSSFIEDYIHSFTTSEKVSEVKDNKIIIEYKNHGDIEKKELEKNFFFHPKVGDTIYIRTDKNGNIKPSINYNIFRVSTTIFITLTFLPGILCELLVIILFIIYPIHNLIKKLKEKNN